MPNAEILFLLFSINCLRYRSAFYHASTVDSTCGTRKKCTPCVCFTKGVDEYKKDGYIGFMDLLIFDVLVLMVIPQSFSVAIKVYVTFGSMISILVGFLLAYLFMRLMKLRTIPGIPLPIMIISVYLFFLDIIMPYGSECIGSNNNNSVLNMWIFN